MRMKACSNCIGVVLGLSGLFMMGSNAYASFGISQFLANYIDFTGTEVQGIPIPFSSEHRGKISHYRAGVWENCMIRAVLGYTDPPGHNPPMTPLHIVKEEFTYGTFPPYVDGELTIGIPSLKTFSVTDAVNWACNPPDEHNLGWAKTNYSFNGGTETTGAYDEETFHAT